jgi:hypothetical protein
MYLYVYLYNHMYMYMCMYMYMYMYRSNARKMLVPWRQSLLMTDDVLKTLIAGSQDTKRLILATALLPKTGGNTGTLFTFQRLLLPK